MEKQDPVVTKLAQNMELFILTANKTLFQVIYK